MPAQTKIGKNQRLFRPSLGIDELYLNRRYRCILTNLEERTLLDLLPGRQQEAVTKRLMSMTERQGRDRQHGHVEAIPPCRPGGAAAGRIVVDKFHVVRMANEALEKVRKGLRKELKPPTNAEPSRVTGRSC